MGVSVSGKSGSAPKIPEGMHEAVCVAIYDLGQQMQTGQYPGLKHKVMLVWETEAGDTIGKEYTASLGDKANLHKDLVMWRGRPFSPEEMSGFGLNKVLGAHCMIQVQHKNSWANVTAIVPSKQKWLPKSPLIDFDIQDEIPSDCPAWIAKKINNATDRFARGEESQSQPQDGSGIPADGGDSEVPF